jgi:hypothetical protein
MSGNWPAELLQAGVREFHLGLDASRTADAEVVGVLRQVTQQSRLPDPGFPPQDENASLAFPGPLKQAGEPSLFLAPPEKFVLGAITSDGIAAGERGIRDMTTTHGSLAPLG